MELICVKYGAEHPNLLISRSVPCRKMESVMEEIKHKYPNKVNVVFLNILKPESQLLMKYYGIAAIPTQVLLNSDGKEFFRHTGYYSSEELVKVFQSKGMQ